MGSLPTYALLAVLLMTEMVEAAAPFHQTNPTIAQLTQIQTNLLAVLEREDRTEWARITTPDFLAFERGKVYNADSFFDLVVNMHKRRIHAKWSVTFPRLDADGTVAIMSYINEGSLRVEDKAPIPTQWLEAVSFRKDGHQWRAFFLTSMRRE